jgi:hypothetical protein
VKNSFPLKIFIPYSLTRPILEGKNGIETDETLPLYYLLEKDLNQYFILSRCRRLVILA